MKKEVAHWGHLLTEQNFIESFNTGFGEYYRLSPLSKVFLSKDKVALIEKEYDAGLEKGGIFFAKQKKKNGNPYFFVEEILFLKNTSPFPHRQYKADSNEFKEAIHYALDNKLLPFQFHSHPTKSENVLFESFAYHQQMDTSDADKTASLFYITIGEIKLRIPEILIVGNGSIGNGIFVGLYGGLVAPLDFNERKHTLMNDWTHRNLDRAKNYFDTPQKQFMGAAAAIVFILLLIKYPKVIFPTAIGAAAILPTFAYTTPDTNEFFGISHGTELEISLPKINDEIILQDETLLIELKKKREQNKKQ